MNKYTLLIVLTFFSSISHADNWKLVPSKDAYWIKTHNLQQHELLVAFYQKKPQFLLILVTNSSPPDKPIAVHVQIDDGLKENAQLVLLEQHKDKSIFRIKVPEIARETYIDRMISGVKFTIYSESKTFAAITFSLLGFTLNLNEMMIANDIGQLDLQWLLKNNKTRELFCYLSSDVTMQAMLLQRRGISLSAAIQSISETGFLLFDQERENVIKQAYNIQRNQLTSRPEHFKYKNFKMCLEQDQPAK